MSREQALGSLDELAGAVWRGRWALGLWVVACLAVAALDLATTKPVFIGAVQLVLEPRERADDGPEVVRLVHQLALDDDQAQTQLHVIESDRLLRSVFDALDLATAPELSPANDDRLTRSLRWLHGLRGTEMPEVARERAFDRFTDRVHARRLALSYVIEIAYRAQDPRQAARVANAVASAYVRQRIANAVADAQVGVPYLNSRIASIYAQELVAGAASASGTVPDRPLADADVRLLGPATVPLGKSFPNAMPALALALVLGLTSGMAGLALSQRADGRLRSARQLRRLGIACLGVIPQIRRTASNAPMWSVGIGDAVFEDALRPVRAALAAQGRLSRPQSIGLLAWTPGAGTRTIAAGLADLLALAGEDVTVVEVDRPLADARPMRASGGAADGSGGAALAAIMASRPLHRTTILALPPLRTCVDQRSVLLRLDAAILVVEAGRSTIGDLRAARRALGHVPLAGVVLNKLPHDAAGRRWARRWARPLAPMASA
jgi:capsular polysaccharide biosynthesis protein